MPPYELYQQVAEAYHTQGKYQERDRFLVLALDAAQTVGQSNLAEQIRLRLLELNPNHLIKPYPHCQAALQAQNFVTYLSQLRKNFPPGKAQSLLNELGGPAPVRRKPTMIADASFPMADPIEEREAPTWSGLSFAKPQPPPPPARPSINVIQPPAPPPDVTTPFPVKPMTDPLANVPMTTQPPVVPFKVQAPHSAPPITPRRPEIIPAPVVQKRDEIVSPSGVWVGNLLFVLLFLSSLALLAYVFVLPFYPEVAKMLKMGS